MAKKKDTYVKQIQNVERLEIMEEKFGVSLEGVNASFQLYNEETGDVTVDVYGEIQTINGTGIAENIKIIAMTYSPDGKVLGTGYTVINANDFFALSPLHIHFFIGDYQEPAKLRIYPTKAS